MVGQVFRVFFTSKAQRRRQQIIDFETQRFSKAHARKVDREIRQPLPSVNADLSAEVPIRRQALSRFAAPIFIGDHLIVSIPYPLTVACTDPAAIHPALRP